MRNVRFSRATHLSGFTKLHINVIIICDTTVQIGEIVFFVVLLNRIIFLTQPSVTLLLQDHVAGFHDASCQTTNYRRQRVLIQEDEQDRDM